MEAVDSVASKSTFAMRGETISTAKLKLEQAIMEMRIKEMSEGYDVFTIRKF